jgi:hypothetical protein
MVIERNSDELRIGMLALTNFPPMLKSEYGLTAYPSAYQLAHPQAG